jgi:hypothetical protein
MTETSPIMTGHDTLNEWCVRLSLGISRSDEEIASGERLTEDGKGRLIWAERQGHEPVDYCHVAVGEQLIGQHG